jgi:LysM repeat protein
MSENFSGKAVVVDFLIGIQSESFKVPAKTALDLIGTAFKDAGSNPSALAVKVGTSIAYLSVGTAKIVGAQGYNFVQVSIEVISGSPISVVSELAGVAMGTLSLMPATYAAKLFLPGAAAPAAPLVGIGVSAILAEGTRAAVKYGLDNSPVGEYVNSNLSFLTLSSRLSVGVPSPSTTFSLPPANLAPLTQLIYNTQTGVPELVFNSSSNLTSNPNVTPGPTTYIVQPGDSLWKIATANAWDLNALKAANPQITDPNFIRVGQVINGFSLGPVTNTFTIAIPYLNSQPSTTNPTNPTNVSGVEAGQIAPGVTFVDPAKVNGLVGYAAAKQGAILGNGFMPANGNIVPTGLQDAQVINWGNVFQTQSSSNSLNNVFKVDPIVGAFSNALNLKAYGIDPLILDLNGDGVQLTSYQDTIVLFDVDNDGGSKEQTGWVAANTITGGTPPAINTDGIVVQDLNSNGVIDNISETLSEYYNGTVGTGGDAGSKPFANGFMALKSLDSNNDNVFNFGWSDRPCRLPLVCRIDSVVGWEA